VLPRNPNLLYRNVRATDAARAHASISDHARTADGAVAVTSSLIDIAGDASSPSSPLTTRNSILALCSAFEYSGTGQAPQWASHSPVVVRS
jgi:hypothetical protein